MENKYIKYIISELMEYRSQSYELTHLSNIEYERNLKNILYSWKKEEIREEKVIKMFPNLMILSYSEFVMNERNKIINTIYGKL